MSEPSGNERRTHCGDCELVHNKHELRVRVARGVPAAR